MLDGAKFVCLENGQEIFPKGRKFTIGYLMDCDYVLAEDSRAERIHCQIDCDAFGHVTIYNKSEQNPITVNGESVNIKRTLFNNSKIKILDKEFLWQHKKVTSNVVAENPEEMLTPNKQIGIPEQPPSSCPALKYHRHLPKRFTMHNLHAFRIDSDENQSIDEDVERQGDISEIPIIVLDATPPKIDVVNSTSDKKTSSTEKRRRAFRNMCGWSGMTTTSYSPRETGVRVEKTFTAIIPPTTPRSALCRTPKGVLERLHLHANGTIVSKQDTNNMDLISFATPTKKAENEKPLLVQHSKSAMKVVDLTTPSKLRPQSPLVKSATCKRPIFLKNEKPANNTVLLQTPKTTINETAASTSSGSAIVVDSSSESDNSCIGAVTSTTPQRTPLPSTQSSALMKHALLTSAKKLIPTAMTTPLRTIVGQAKTRTPRLPLNTSAHTSTRNITITTPVTTQGKGTPNTTATHFVSSSSSSKVISTIKKNPPSRRLDVSANTTEDSVTGVMNKKCSTPVSIVKPKLLATDKGLNTLLTTSTPYKNTNAKINESELENTSQYVSALQYSHVNEDETGHQTISKDIADDQPKVENDDILKEIEEILNTSDELKKQLRDTKCDEDEGDEEPEETVEAATSEKDYEKINKQYEMHATTSRKLVEEIENIIECTTPTKSVNQSTAPVKNNLTALILLKAINSTEKCKSSGLHKDDEKENQINECAATPTTARRRISMSATDVSTNSASAVEDNGNAGSVNTPLTPKRITRRRSSISLDKDELMSTNITQRNIDHYNTENMGAIVEEIEEIETENVLVPESELENDLPNRSTTNDPKTPLDATSSLFATENIDSNDGIPNDVITVNTAIEEHCMSPSQCLDESFAEPLNSEEYLNEVNLIDEEEEREQEIYELKQQSVIESEANQTETLDKIMNIEENTFPEPLSSENMQEIDESFGEIELQTNEFNRTFDVEENAIDMNKPMEENVKYEELIKEISKPVTVHNDIATVEEEAVSVKISKEDDVNDKEKSIENPSNIEAETETIKDKIQTSLGDTSSLFDESIPTENNELKSDRDNNMETVTAFNENAVEQIDEIAHDAVLTSAEDPSLKLNETVEENHTQGINTEVDLTEESTAIAAEERIPKEINLDVEVEACEIANKSSFVQVDDSMSVAKDETFKETAANEELVTAAISDQTDAIDYNSLLLADTRDQVKENVNKSVVKNIDEVEVEEVEENRIVEELEKVSTEFVEEEMHELDEELILRIEDDDDENSAETNEECTKETMPLKDFTSVEKVESAGEILECSNTNIIEEQSNKETGVDITVASQTSDVAKEIELQEDTKSSPIESPKEEATEKNDVVEIEEEMKLHDLAHTSLSNESTSKASGDCIDESAHIGNQSTVEDLPVIKDNLSSKQLLNENSEQVHTVDVDENVSADSNTPQLAVENVIPNETTIEVTPHDYNETESEFASVGNCEEQHITKVDSSMAVLSETTTFNEEPQQSDEIVFKNQITNEAFEIQESSEIEENIKDFSLDEIKTDEVNEGAIVTESRIEDQASMHEESVTIESIETIAEKEDLCKEQALIDEPEPSNNNQSIVEESTQIKIEIQCLTDKVVEMPAEEEIGYQIELDKNHSLVEDPTQYNIEDQVPSHEAQSLAEKTVEEVSQEVEDQETSYKDKSLVEEDSEKLADKEIEQELLHEVQSLAEEPKDDDIEDPETSHADQSVAENIVEEPVQEIQDQDISHKQSLVEEVVEVSTDDDMEEEPFNKNKSFAEEIVEIPAEEEMAQAPLHKNESLAEEDVEAPVGKEIEEETSNEVKSLIEDVIEVPADEKIEEDSSNRDQSLAEEVVEIASDEDLEEGPLNKGKSFVAEVIEVPAEEQIEEEASNRDKYLVEEVVETAENAEIDEDPSNEGKSIVEEVVETPEGKDIEEETSNEDKALVEEVIEVPADEKIEEEASNRDKSLTKEVVEVPVDEEVEEEPSNKDKSIVEEVVDAPADEVVEEEPSNKYKSIVEEVVEAPEGKEIEEEASNKDKSLTEVSGDEEIEEPLNNDKSHTRNIVEVPADEKIVEKPPNRAQSLIEEVLEVASDEEIEEEPSNEDKSHTEEVIEMPTIEEREDSSNKDKSLAEEIVEVSGDEEIEEQKTNNDKYQKTEEKDSCSRDQSNANESSIGDTLAKNNDTDELSKIENKHSSEADRLPSSQDPIQSKVFIDEFAGKESPPSEKQDAEICVAETISSHEIGGEKRNSPALQVPVLESVPTGTTLERMKEETVTVQQISSTEQISILEIKATSTDSASKDKTVSEEENSIVESKVAKYSNQAETVHSTEDKQRSESFLQDNYDDQKPIEKSLLNDDQNMEASKNTAQLNPAAEEDDEKTAGNMKSSTSEALVQTAESKESLQRDVVDTTTQRSLRRRGAAVVKYDVSSDSENESHRPNNRKRRPQKAAQKQAQDSTMNESNIKEAPSKRVRKKKMEQEDRTDPESPKKRARKNAKQGVETPLPTESTPEAMSTQESDTQLNALDINESLAKTLKKPVTSRSRRGATKAQKEPSMVMVADVKDDSQETQNEEIKSQETGAKTERRRGGRKIGETQAKEAASQQSESEVDKVVEIPKPQKKATTRRARTQKQENVTENPTQQETSAEEIVKAETGTQKPVRRPRGKKAVEIVEDTSEDQRHDVANTPTVVEEKIKPAAKRKGRQTKATTISSDDNVHTLTDEKAAIIFNDLGTNSKTVEEVVDQKVSASAEVSTTKKPRARRGKNVTPIESTASVAPEEFLIEPSKQDAPQSVDESSKPVRGGRRGKQAAEVTDSPVATKRRKPTKIELELSLAKEIELEESNQPEEPSSNIEIAATTDAKKPRARRGKTVEPIEIVAPVVSSAASGRRKPTTTKAKAEAAKHIVEEIDTEHEDTKSAQHDEPAAEEPSTKKARSRRQKVAEPVVPEILEPVKTGRGLRRKHVHFDEEPASISIAKAENVETAIDHIPNEATVSDVKETAPKRRRRR